MREAFIDLIHTNVPETKALLIIGCIMLVIILVGATAQLIVNIQDEAKKESVNKRYRRQ